MEFIDELQKISKKQMKSLQLTDIIFGTVISVNPLIITIISDEKTLEIPENLLHLTESVVEKKISTVEHRHNVNHNHATDDGGTSYSNICSTELGGITCFENGEALPNETGYIMLNRGLEIGDKVIMLQVLSGQQFIVLSRVF